MRKNSSFVFSVDIIKLIVDFDSVQQNINPRPMMSEPVDSNRSNWAVLKDCLLYWQDHFEGLSTSSSSLLTMLLLQFFRTDKAYIVNLSQKASFILTKMASFLSQVFIINDTYVYATNICQTHHCRIIAYIGLSKMVKVHLIFG